MGEMPKVLIVDDESRNQRIIIEVIEDFVQFKVASSGEEALKVLGEFHPDLVLLDIMMPGIDGYEVCRQIRANPKFKFTKILLVSGKAMIEERLQGYEVGADDYITKPFMIEELLAKVKVFLRLASMETQLDGLNKSLDEEVQERTRQLLEVKAKLINAGKMSALGEMAGGIAHEINTPLGTIGLLIGQIQDLVDEEPIDIATVHKMTGIVEQTVHRISAIINGLRTFSREGSQDQFNPASVNQIVRDTLMLCNEKLKHQDINIEVSPIGEDLTIPCQSIQVSQVLLNLISNSCDAVMYQKEKWIKISAGQDGDNIQISVTDSGVGIPEDVLEKVFQPFFTTKEIGKGTGLGLSISEGIMKIHQGSIEVDRSSKNTRFVLTFPVEHLDVGVLGKASA